MPAAALRPPLEAGDHLFEHLAIVSFILALFGWRWFRFVINSRLLVSRATQYQLFAKCVDLFWCSTAFVVRWGLGSVTHIRLRGSK